MHLSSLELPTHELLNDQLQVLMQLPNLRALGVYGFLCLKDLSQQPCNLRKLSVYTMGCEHLACLPLHSLTQPLSIRGPFHINLSNYEAAQAAIANVVRCKAGWAPVQWLCVYGFKSTDRPHPDWRHAVTVAAPLIRGCKGWIGFDMAANGVLLSTLEACGAVLTGMTRVVVSCCACDSFWQALHHSMPNVQRLDVRHGGCSPVSSAAAAYVQAAQNTGKLHTVGADFPVHYQLQQSLQGGRLVTVTNYKNMMTWVPGC